MVSSLSFGFPLGPGGCAGCLTVRSSAVPSRPFSDDQIHGWPCCSFLPTNGLSWTLFPLADAQDPPLQKRNVGLFLGAEKQAADDVRLQIIAELNAGILVETGLKGRRAAPIAGFIAICLAKD